MIDYFALNLAKFWTSAYNFNCITVFDKSPLSMYILSKQNWPFWSLEDSFLGKFYYKVFPRMDNRRLLIKNSIRIAIKACIPKVSGKKYIHSTDNFEEAIEYINIIAPEELGKILLYINKISGSKGNKMKSIKDTYSWFINSVITDARNKAEAKASKDGNNWT